MYVIRFQYQIQCCSHNLLGALSVSGSRFPTFLYSKLDLSQATHSCLVLVTVGNLVVLAMLEEPYIDSNEAKLHKKLHSQFMG